MNLPITEQGRPPSFPASVRSTIPGSASPDAGTAGMTTARTVPALRWLGWLESVDGSTKMFRACLISDLTFIRYPRQQNALHEQECQWAGALKKNKIRPKIREKIKTCCAVLMLLAEYITTNLHSEDTKLSAPGCRVIAASQRRVQTKSEISPRVLGRDDSIVLFWHVRTSKQKIYLRLLKTYP